MEVTLKIDGRPITVETDKMHQTWIDKCLAYGIRRLPNDTYSASKGNTKYELVSGLVKDMQSGKEAPSVLSGGSTVDPVMSLALKNAKASLAVMFRELTGETKALDFAKHEKVSPFFKVTEDRAAWIDATVVKWMEKQVEKGEKDYIADAKTALTVIPADKVDLDF